MFVARSQHERARLPPIQHSNDTAPVTASQPGRFARVRFRIVWPLRSRSERAASCPASTHAHSSALMDGDLGTPGTQGLQANFSITNFTRSEALEEAIMVQVSAKPTFSAVAPAWVTT